MSPVGPGGPAAEEFTKYQERGAYHWQEIGRRLPTRYSARLHALYSWFVGEVGARRPATLVDIGCGDAALTHLMAEATGGRVIGIEPEPAGVEFAQRALDAAGSPATVSQGRGESLAFEDASVDVVTMCEVVEHIPDPVPLLREAARILSPTGALLVSTPQWQKAELRPFHVREYRGEELGELLRGSFAEARVQASEPGRLQDVYAARRSARVALNLMSQAGFNPFAVRRPATAERARWRQLVAVAQVPREG